MLITCAAIGKVLEISTVDKHVTQGTVKKYVLITSKCFHGTSDKTIRCWRKEQNAEQWSLPSYERGSFNLPETRSLRELPKNYKCG